MCEFKAIYLNLTANQQRVLSFYCGFSEFSANAISLLTPANVRR